MENFFEHAVLGFCWWDVLAGLVLIAATACFLIIRHKLKKEKKDLENNLSN